MTVLFPITVIYKTVNNRKQESVFKLKMRGHKTERADILRNSIWHLKDRRRRLRISD